MIKDYLTYLRENKEGKLVKTVDRESIIYSLNGELHREDGPAVEYLNGSKFWFKNGQRHRDDGGPASEFFGGKKSWHKNDKLHRVDGPAVEHPNGRKEWWYEGKHYSRSRIEKLSDNHPLKRGYIKYKFGL